MVLVVLTKTLSLTLATTTFINSKLRKQHAYIGNEVIIIIRGLAYFSST